MSVKKKLGLGVASAALGLALVGGGTWAAFNDIEQVDNAFAAGTLNLEVGNVEGVEATFDLSNLKPGDTMEREFILHNAGSLAIKEVLMTTSFSGFQNGKNEYVQRHGAPDNGPEDFLDQFVVEIIDVDRQLKVVENKTLKQLLSDTPNLAPVHPGQEEWNGIPLEPADSEQIRIKIKFKDDATVGVNGEQAQNVYQGDSINVHFTLEATQWDGLTTEQTKDNGYLEMNEEANSN